MLNSLESSERVRNLLYERVITVDCGSNQLSDGNTGRVPTLTLSSIDPPPLPPTSRCCPFMSGTALVLSTVGSHPSIIPLSVLSSGPFRSTPSAVSRLSVQPHKRCELSSQQAGSTVTLSPAARSNPSPLEESLFKHTRRVGRIQG